MCLHKPLYAARLMVAPLVIRYHALIGQRVVDPGHAGARVCGTHRHPPDVVVSVADILTIDNNNSITHTLTNTCKQNDKYKSLPPIRSFIKQDIISEYIIMGR